MADHKRVSRICQNLNFNQDFPTRGIWYQSAILAFMDQINFFQFNPSLLVFTVTTWSSYHTDGTTTLKWSKYSCTGRMRGGTDSSSRKSEGYGWSNRRYWSWYVLKMICWGCLLLFQLHNTFYPDRYHYPGTDRKFKEGSRRRWANKNNWRYNAALGII